MIKKLVIKNFKGIRSADIEFDQCRNVLVGDNGVGKSTIIEAMLLALGYGLNKLEVTPSLFYIDCSKDFKINKKPPEIIVEIYFDDNVDQTPVAVFSGTNNTKHINAVGIQLKISFDKTYQDIYDLEVKNNGEQESVQIPCEYYKVERNWFSDQCVNQRLLPYLPIIIDSSSSYFNSTSTQYIVSLLQKYIGDEDTIKIKKDLRVLKDKFDRLSDLNDINSKLKQKREDLSVSLDITSDIITRNILSPLLNQVPVSQSGSGALCMLKTDLSLDKGKMSNRQKIVFIEEPESHLSHTNMYVLLEHITKELNPSNTQLFVTTHNNFVANKLNLSKLILLTKGNGEMTAVKIACNKELSEYFTKVSDYPTLRLLLCKAAILVEGPADEIVVTYYYQKTYRHHPFSDHIELITVGGVKFKHFVELARECKKRVAVITDNDGAETLDDVCKIRGIEQQTNLIKVFTDDDSKENTTLEPCFINANQDKLEALSEAVRMKEPSKADTKESLIQFMTKNKTEWAYRLLCTLDKKDTPDFTIPQYIKDAVDWARNG